MNSDAQLVDALTKDGDKLQKFFAMGSAWRITYDPTMLSAKRRKALGIYDPLENQDTLNSSDDESEPKEESP